MNDQTKCPTCGHQQQFVASTSEQNDLSEARYLLAIFLHAYENDQRMNATHLASAKKLAAPANTRTVAGKE